MNTSRYSEMYNNKMLSGVTLSGDEDSRKKKDSSIFRKLNHEQDIVEMELKDISSNYLPPYTKPKNGTNKIAFKAKVNSKKLSEFKQRQIISFGSSRKKSKPLILPPAVDFTTIA